MDNHVAKQVYETADFTQISYTYYSYDAGSLSRRVYEVGSNVLATYSRTTGPQTGGGYIDRLYVDEYMVYGASRLGVENSGKELANISFTITGNLETGINPVYGTLHQLTYDYSYRQVSDKFYERANHLGNVLVVVTDRKIEYGIQNYYTADVVSYSDYSPYGTLLDGRHGNETSYRYGYQGSEKDDELKGSGNSYTTHFRLLDPRIGRWFSTDPVFQPWQSPYTSMDNNPISLNDVLGNHTNDWVAKEIVGADGTKTNSWQWVDKSYNSLEEAKADGWSDWSGKSAVMRGILNDRAIGGVCNMLLMSGGNYIHWYDNDEVTITANGVSRDNSSDGGTMVNGLLVQDPLGNPMQQNPMGNFDFNAGIGGGNNRAFSDGNVTKEIWAQWLHARANVQAVNDFADGLMKGTTYAVAGGFMFFEVGGAQGVSTFVRQGWNAGGRYAAKVYGGIKSGYEFFDNHIGSKIDGEGMFWNYINQSFSTGDYSLGSKDLVSFGLSGAGKGKPVWMQSAMGTSGAFFQYSLNQGPTSPFIQKSAVYTMGTFATGMLQPRLANGRYGNNLSSTVVYGTIQMYLEQYEKSRKK